MFQHFLITRFNLRKADWKTNKKNVAVLTEEWHANRFDLFTNYCFPSVASQTQKNFKWLVFFDTNTSVKYRSLIAELQQELLQFTPLFVDGMDAFLPTLQEHVASCEAPYIISSGLDNDDCLSKHYVASVQRRFDEQDFMAVDFIDGYTLQVSPTIKLGKKLHLFNPFISLIEKNEQPKTVSMVSHRNWKRETNIIHVPNERIWASVIHQENKVNEFTGYDAVATDHFFDLFVISENKKQHILANILPQQEWKLTSFRNKLDSKWNVASKKIKKKLGFYK